MNRGGRREVAAFFDRAAAEGAMEAFGPEELAVVQRQLGRWRLAPGSAVLELGCGSGRLTPLLRRAVGPDGSVVPFDLSLGMLARARRRGGGPWVAAVAERLPFPAASFHVCVCFQVLPHLADRPAALAEIARVLRHGGLLWVAHTLRREEVNALHRGLGPPVSGHLLPEPGRLVQEAGGAGLTLLVLEDGSDGFLAGFERRS